jgi:hypothetical protein
MHFLSLDVCSGSTHYVRALLLEVVCYTRKVFLVYVPQLTHTLTASPIFFPSNLFFGCGIVAVAQRATTALFFIFF